jgi:uncharacterized protein (DUF302 family)
MAVCPLNSSGTIARKWCRSVHPQAWKHRQHRRTKTRWIVMTQEAGFVTRSKVFALTTVICLWGTQAMAADGLTTLRSSYGPKDTMNRLEAEVKAKGMTVFARVDHTAGAAEVGLSLRPTELLIFGNAKGGTPLMQSIQTIGIDLPLKALVWQDASGNTWLSYNDPSWLAKRHGLDPENRPDAQCPLCHGQHRRANGNDISVVAHGATRSSPVRSTSMSICDQEISFRR